MADTGTSGNAPKFVSTLAVQSEEARRATLSRTHTEYTSHTVSWQVQLDAFEGDGGFLDGTYLWPYRRESDDDFKERRLMARYHNYLEALVDIYVRFMFTQEVSRTSKSKDYDTWLQDVDGAGTGINDYLKGFASMALVNGHAGTLMDKTTAEPLGPTKAEEQSRVIACLFQAPTIADWRYDGNQLDGVKLFERGPMPGLAAQEVPPSAPVQYLLWDEEGWARFDDGGRLLSADKPGLGMVPFVVLRPKASHLSKMLGRALVSNANILRALFNRSSEEDEVIRAQAFSVLTVSVDKEGDVNEARQALGNVVGSAKAIVVKGQVEYKTPDQEVPAAIRSNQQYLVQEMYRAAHVRLQKDSLAAESGDSIRLQYTELNEMLQGFAKSLATAEKQIARCYFAWQYPNPVTAQKEFEAAEPRAVYPEEFFLDDLEKEITAWAEALQLDLGPTMSKRIKKRAARRVDPDMPPDVQDAVDKEIDAQPDDQLIPGKLPPGQMDTGNPDGLQPPPKPGEAVAA